MILRKIVCKILKTYRLMRKLKYVLCTILPAGNPSGSKESDAAAISVIRSLKDKEPLMTMTMLDVL